MSDIDVLAETVDRWVALSSVAVTETNARLIINQLDGAQALMVAGLIDKIGWVDLEISDRGGDIPRDLLSATLTHVRLSVAKPPAPADIEFILTNAAFAAALSRDTVPSRFWVRRLSQALATVSVRFAPWYDDTIDPFMERLPEPRKVVRFLQPFGLARSDLSRWILRDPDAALPSDDSAFKVWKQQAAGAVAAAIANEVEADGTLLFRGPPVSRFRAAKAEMLANEAFANLQRAATWAYDSPRELENRQGLLAAEVARSALRDGTLQALCDVVAPALDGARIAYNFGVNQQSKDTLKALADLRKAVMDETSKLTESTRTLAAAVSGAVFGAISLVVARLTLAPNSAFVAPAAVIIGAVLAAYVAAVIGSGVHFLRLQRTLRQEWRPRLYSFLTAPEYARLVSDPVVRAERGYVFAAWAGGIMSSMLIAAAIAIVLTPLPERSKPAPAPTPGVTPTLPSTVTARAKGPPRPAAVISGLDNHAH